MSDRIRARIVRGADPAIEEAATRVSQFVEPVPLIAYVLWASMPDGSTEPVFQIESVNGTFSFPTTRDGLESLAALIFEALAEDQEASR